MSGFAISIADAVKRFDGVEIVSNNLELLAQALDVAVDRAIVDIDLIVIGCVHQTVAALHKARPLRERLQDKELGDRETNLLAIPGAFMTLRIERELAANE